MDTADALLKGSADEYATVRAAYLQYRWNVIHDGAPPEDEEMAPPASTVTPAADSAPAGNEAEQPAQSTEPSEAKPQS